MMASTKLKTPTLGENPHRNGLQGSHGLAPALEEPPADRAQEADQGSWIAFAVWFLAFVFLCTLLLWDLVTAILFR
jgi:hypothetical protein